MLELLQLAVSIETLVEFDESMRRLGYGNAVTYVPAYIYVMKLQSKESDMSLYKIGRTSNPERRIKEVARSSQVKTFMDDFELFYVLLVSTPFAKEEELFLHDHFYSKRIGGYATEWFALQMSDIKAIYKYYGRIFAKSDPEEYKDFMCLD